MDFTFGIITDGKSDTNLNLIIHSIKNQNITNYEIIIVGNTSLIYDEIKVIKFDDSHHKPWITRKKNLITQNAKYENIVFMHDYIRLDDNWYSGWENFGDFKCATNKIINLDGTRYRDWTIVANEWNCPNSIKVPITRLETLLPYDIDKTNINKHIYLSGAYWVAKKDIMMEIPLDESRFWGDGEDVYWANEFTKKYEFSLNVNSSVHLLKYKDKIVNHMSPNTINTIKNYKHND